MTTDFLILIAAGCSFVLFVLLQAVCFRRIDTKDVIAWVWYLYVIAVGFSVVLAISIAEKITGFILIMPPVVVSLLIAVYIIGIFGVIESSIRLRVFELVVQSKTQGISSLALSRIYNTRTIVEKRLARLINSGDIFQKNKKYYPAQKLSAFALMVYITTIIIKLYE